jgi:hypothetical protein
VFKWAGGANDAYFARMSTNQISVYDASNMLLLDKKSLKLEGVRDFEWSPTDNILSVYQPEIGNQPARISLIAIPSRCGRSHTRLPLQSFVTQLSSTASVLRPVHPPVPCKPTTVCDIVSPTIFPPPTSSLPRSCDGIQTNASA